MRVCRQFPATLPAPRRETPCSAPRKLPASARGIASFQCLEGRSQKNSLLAGSSHPVAGGGSRLAQPVAADIEMQVVVMLGVAVRGQHDREVPAGAADEMA